MVEFRSVQVKRNLLAVQRQLTLIHYLLSKTIKKENLGETLLELQLLVINFYYYFVCIMYFLFVFLLDVKIVRRPVLTPELYFANRWTYM